MECRGSQLGCWQSFWRLWGRVQKTSCPGSTVHQVKSLVQMCMQQHPNKKCIMLHMLKGTFMNTSTWIYLRFLSRIGS